MSLLSCVPSLLPFDLAEALLFALISAAVNGSVSSLQANVLKIELLLSRQSFLSIVASPFCINCWIRADMLPLNDGL